MLLQFNFNLCFMHYLYFCKVVCGLSGNSSKLLLTYLLSGYLHYNGSSYEQLSMSLVRYIQNCAVGILCVSF